MKVLFIGLDSVDINLLAKFEEYLPNLTKLKKTGQNVKIESVFPPDSDTAWATIYTSLNPAEHGIIEFVDPLEKSMKIQHVEKDNTPIKFKTFWDIAGNCGKKVCVITPHLCYPVWEVNGIMIGRSSVEDKIDTYPKDLIIKHPELESLIPWKGFPVNKELL
jgi:predicted AlkP superfamily phosphohydrolase/phosphomutase